MRNSSKTQRDMNETSYEFEHLGLKVKAKIAQYKNFIDCEKYIESPFSASITGLPNDFDFHAFEQIVIYCSLPEDQVLKIVQSSQMPQSICVSIIEKFVEEKWLGKKKILYKTLTCNPSESQYMYLIEK